MHVAEVVVSQYRAALAMLEECITVCPEPLWNSPDDKVAYWHIAYHTLFFTQLYLQDTARSLKPWAKFRKDYHYLGSHPDPSRALPEVYVPYGQEGLLEYVEFCREQVAERVPQMDLEGPSGFDWLPFSRLEAQIYTIRHLQQHTGELMERLGARAGVDVDWVAGRNS
jgi:hypothetical protein